MKLCRIFLGAFLLFTVTRPALAQVESAAGQAYSARADLEVLLSNLERSAQSTAYSDGLRATAAQRAEQVRDRLQTGDFQVGDRIVIIVQNQLMLTDTFTVAQGQVLVLPEVGDLSLAGVLRSELKDFVSVRIESVVLQPIVQASALMRVGIFGGVGRPGFYTLAGDVNIGGAIMIAGGATQLAIVEGITIRREDRVLWEARPLQAAVAEGHRLESPDHDDQAERSEADHR